jgi:two-component system sensor histidine kinase BaeS
VNAQRWLVLLTLFAGSVVALGLSLVLAHSIGAQLLRITDTVIHFSPDHAPELLPETGPTELKQLTGSLNQMQTKLYTLERSRKRLLAGIVHEIARPLGSIKAAAQTIAGSTDLADPALHMELAQGIDEQIDQLRLQLDDLALLGELELQGVKLARLPTDLAEIVFAQCDTIAPFAQRQQITIDTDAVVPLPIIRADPKRIGQIIGNLLHNGCKYTTSGGCITLRTEVRTFGESTWAAVDVCDNGPGIAKMQQDAIFQFFYRGPEQRRIYQGMGIGLALARQLAEAHGGTLTVESTPMHGAIFTLLLPLQPAA